jgi:transposase InsO family protein
MKPPSPRDPREAVALFRAEIVGALTHRPLSRGALRAELEALAAVPRRPPGASVTRRFGVSTLERWYYTYKAEGLAGLLPKARSDRGHARALTAEQRQTILDIRREYPLASAELILENLKDSGHLEADSVSPRALRRLFRAEGMDRPARAAALDPHARLRWQASHPGAIWQVDVCHGKSLRGPSGLIPVRVHGMIDDASRYVVGLEAMATERERDMLTFLAAAIRRHGFPAAIYLDNGSTYSGQALRVACERLGVTLIHSTPHEPQGRGKIERFFRTLREKCLDYTGTCSSLHEVNARLLAFLDRSYHTRPHAGLLGRTPASVWAEGASALRPFDAAVFAEAFTVRLPRRVRRDSTLELDGQTFEVAQGFLAGKRVEVAQRQIDGREAWVEHEGRRFELKPVNPQANATRSRDERPRHENRTDFDPATTRLDRAMGRRPRKTSDASPKTPDRPAKPMKQHKN